MINPRPSLGIQWHDKREALVHLTKDGQAKANLPNNLPVPFSAKDKLLSILNDRMIKSSFVNHMDQLFPDVPHAVSFSEALPETISQLVYHPSYQNYGYEPYGIMVHKESAFSQNGGPVWYINNEIFKALTNDLRTTCPPRSISQELLFLLSPYAPYWSSIRSHRNTPMDWTQEREWRCPEDFALPFINGRPDFFVIVKTDQDMRDILALGLCGLSNTDFLTIRNSPNCSLPLIPNIF